MHEFFFGGIEGANYTLPQMYVEEKEGDSCCNSASLIPRSFPDQAEKKRGRKKIFPFLSASTAGL